MSLDTSNKNWKKIDKVVVLINWLYKFDIEYKYFIGAKKPGEYTKEQCDYFANIWNIYMATLMKG